MCQQSKSTCRYQREITRNRWMWCVFPRPHLYLNVAWVAVLSASSSPWICNSKHLFLCVSLVWWCTHVILCKSKCVCVCVCVCVWACMCVCMCVCVWVCVREIFSQTNINPSTPHHTDRQLLIPGFFSLICYRCCGLQQTNRRSAAGKWLYMTCLFPIK